MRAMTITCPRARAAKDAERASLRHKVEAEGEAERLLTELRHNPFESALGKLI